MSDLAEISNDEPLAVEPGHLSNSGREPSSEPVGTCHVEPGVENPAELTGDLDAAVEPEIVGEGWSGADIEEAYLKALSAMEAIPPESEAPVVETNSTKGIPDAPEPAAAVDSLPVDGSSNHQKVDPAKPVAEAESAHASATPASGLRLARSTDRPPRNEAIEDYSNVSPAQIIEAAMFVGGTPLTARKIVGLLRGSFDTAFVEQAIEDLNSAYLAQERPYEIRHGEGGYRLELRPEYDRLRHRVYGSGPREVRLAQDVLEVLALVAYRQPISQKDIESHRKQNAGNLIRQLLRRDLISFERGPGGRKDLQYHTSPRFLSVFGIASLEDLPQAEDLAKK